MMKKILYALLLLPSVALASPPGDFGREMNDPQSSLSHTRQGTIDSSGERAREKSRSKSHAERDSTSRDHQKSFSREVNINSLLIQMFTARYEQQHTGTGEAGEYFGLCNTFTKMISDYPTVNETEGEVAGRAQVNEDSGRSGGLMSRPAAGLQDDQLAQTPYVRRYIQCRITAGGWLAEAGNRAARTPAKSDSEIRQIIGQVFAQMDSDDQLFERVRQHARDVWSSVSCTNWVDDFIFYKGPDIQCGTVVFDSHGWQIENRQTLSAEAIDGTAYKISLSDSDSTSTSSENSRSREAKASEGNRYTTSR
ncbi:hypothetical protein MIZ01_1591 [Sideroxyarcus emersonii]|uniref:Uncharacterized protein n=1 Tax=Sideroxyarcus emersonii TaxID=2764705 RepID=A0AAN1XAG1_9PROT|nr:hypothetical protein [Sideroxyarcus emersonii]BCK87795.1 hypothetical protein MIZ01_1591 [Sideroxyarcus emersonii]